jgi:Rad3-related DNA helicase
MLQLVVIDKLPFPPPDDPLVEARSRLLESVGRFMITCCPRRHWPSSKGLGV